MNLTGNVMNKYSKLSKDTHLIWDWNGTLQNDAWLCVDIMNKLLQKRNKTTITLQQYREIFGFPVRDYYKKVGFDFALELFEELAVEYISEYDRRSWECSLQTSAVDVLNWCAGKNIAQYILSASQQKPLEINIAHYGLDRYFQRVVGLSDFYAKSKIKNGKQLVAEIGADNIVLIGDTTHDYEVAQAIGVDCILYSAGHQSKRRLNECGVVVIEKLSDILSVV